MFKFSKSQVSKISTAELAACPGDSGRENADTCPTTGASKIQKKLKTPERCARSAFSAVEFD
jgi:hypothetical protein